MDLPQLYIDCLLFSLETIYLLLIVISMDHLFQKPVTITSEGIFGVNTLKTPQP